MGNSDHGSTHISGIPTAFEGREDTTTGLKKFDLQDRASNWS